MPFTVRFRWLWHVPHVFLILRSALAQSTHAEQFEALGNEVRLGNWTQPAGPAYDNYTHGRVKARRAMAATVDAITGTVDETALLVRGVGDTTAATLGATLRLTGGLTRGLGQAVQTFGETQVVKSGPLAAPSRVFAGVYRIAAAVLTGAGNATIGLGGTVEGIASEAAKVAEDSVKVLSEPTRSLGLALRGQSRKPLPDSEMETEAPKQPSPASSYLVTRPRQRRVVEQVARRLLRDAFGSPSERTVALAPPLTLALFVAWILGRASRPSGPSTSGSSSYADHLHVESLIPENGDQSRQVSDERTLPPSTGAKLWRHVRHFRRRRCSCCRRSPVWLHCAGLVIVLTVVLSVDQEQQRRARIVEQGLGVSYSGTTGEESVRWLNMVLSAVWTPLQKTISGLGEELATLATFTLSAQEQDALSIAFENVTFGLNPPVFDAVRMPRETAARALLTAMQEARHRRPEGSVEPQVVMLEADFMWVADRFFEVVVKASARSSVRLNLFPQLRVRLRDLVFGPVPIAVAMEAAPQGYPYVGLVALTFLTEPAVDFSITPDGILGGAVSALPLLREALTAGLVSSLPNLDNDDYQVLVYDLGEYLAPGLFPVPSPVDPAAVDSAGRPQRPSFRWPFKLPFWHRNATKAMDIQK
mmetsp:Transcript_14640/g.32330  ORF Transcript_14640/g.32330 Transcript_14640/m.32330 type:complete len:646 (-) Transcript_14640:221-2158(-)